MKNKDKKPTYTPGPWVFHAHSKEIVSESGAVVAQVTGIPPQLLGYAPSNACLMACAPELLEALKTMLFTLDEKRLKDMTAQSGYSVEIFLAARKQAKAAVAKAEGRTE